MADAASSPIPTLYEIERQAAAARRHLRLREGRARTALERAGPGASEEQLRELIEETWPNRPVEERSDMLAVALRLQADRGTVIPAAAPTSSIPPRSQPMPTTSADQAASQLPPFDKAQHSAALTQLIRSMLVENPEVTQPAILARIPRELGISAEGLNKRVSDRLSYERTVLKHGSAPTAASAPEQPQPAAARAGKQDAPERPLASRARLSACSDIGSVEVVQTAEGTWSFHANLGTLDFTTADRLFGELRALVVRRAG